MVGKLLVNCLVRWQMLSRVQYISLLFSVLKCETADVDVWLNVCVSQSCQSECVKLYFPLWLSGSDKMCLTERTQCPHLTGCGASCPRVLLSLVSLPWVSIWQICGSDDRHPATACSTSLPHLLNSDHVCLCCALHGSRFITAYNYSAAHVYVSI